MRSLSARLLVTVSLLLIVFLGVAALVLDIAFRDASEQAVRDVLQVHVLALLSAADPDAQGNLVVSEDPPVEHFTNPGSGVYGGIASDTGSLVWRSGSSIGIDIQYATDVAPGENRFGWLMLADGSQVMALSMGITWEFEDKETRNYTFSAARSLAPYYEQVNRFRRRLLGSFAGLAALLLASLGVVLRWVLKPLRRAESEIKEIEAGHRQELSNGYPTELQGLTTNMNTLIRVGLGRLARYRDTLGNLAHSLKTPLAAMRTTLEHGTPDPADLQTLQEQIDRMDEMVAYQLKKAATSGGLNLGRGPVDVGETSDRICKALSRIYRDKQPTWKRNEFDGGYFYGDAGDLTEVMGNLLDNAFKWCRGDVAVSLEALASEDKRRAGLRLVVEDDGPGISSEHSSAVTDRGTRIDRQTAGHGIGLAVVKEIVEVYGGTLGIDASPMGGARVEVRFPPA